MGILKFYFYSSIIWFIIIICSHIVFYKQFKKAMEKIKKATNDNTKKWGYFKTIIVYLLLSFIPIIRLFELVTYFITISNPDKMIEIIKEKEKNNNGNYK